MPHSSRLYRDEWARWRRRVRSPHASACGSIPVPRRGQAPRRGSRKLAPDGVLGRLGKQGRNPGYRSLGMRSPVGAKETIHRPGAPQASRSWCPILSAFFALRVGPAQSKGRATLTAPLLLLLFLLFFLSFPAWNLLFRPTNCVRTHSRAALYQGTTSVVPKNAA